MKASIRIVPTVSKKVFLVALEASELRVLGYSMLGEGKEEIGKEGDGVSL